MRPLIAADNKSSGSQFVSDGPGDQNVALGNGFQYNDRSDRRNITIVASVPDMPSIWQAVNGAGSGSSEPTRAAMIDWLMRPLDQSLPNTHRQHVELLSEAAPGTGKWVLDSDEFQAWKDPSSSLCILPMHGILGAGKSVLASLIIQSIKEDARSQHDTACIYLYFQDGDGTLSTARFWAILLEQLLPHDGRGRIAAELISKFNASFQGSLSLHSSEYWGLFKAQAEMFKTVYLVLEGVPDSYLGRDVRALHSVFDALKKLPPNVRLLFTSRRDWLARSLGVECELLVTPKVTDIETYVNYRIERDTNLNRVLAKRQHREFVVNKITTLTLKSGMFLLARLHLDNLSKHVTLADIRDALSHLPADSSGVFGASILRITEKHSEFERKLAKHVLTWVVHAKVGLTVSQVQDSFAMQQHRKGESYREHRPSEDSVISVGAGLIIKDSDNGTLGLVHESAQAHLWRHNLILKDADLAMAKTCLTCLLVDETGDEGQTPLLSYAASHWLSHLGNNCQGADAEAHGLIKEFLRDSTKLTRAFNAIPSAPGSGLGGITGLHAAVYFNLRSYAKYLIKAGCDVNARCSNGQTALHWAVRLGRRSLLKYLIRRSADTNIRDKTNDTPLHVALKRPVTNLGIVQGLVAGGAKLDIPGAQRLTALSWAIEYGPTAAAEVLLKSQDNMNDEITPGWTSLRELFCHDHSNVQPPGTSTDRWKSLGPAVEDHVRYLIGVVLDRGVDLNLATTDGWLPLRHAIITKSLSRVKRLLAREPLPADVNKRDPEWNWSPLRWAFFSKQPAVVRLLVEHGADVNENNADGWTPLIQAVRDSNEDIVWLLLKMGARTETLDNKKRPALFYAIEGRNKNIVWLLATSKANIRLHSNVLLELALANNDYSVAWLLCEHGADPDATDEGMTLLHRASRRGRLRDVSFLLDRGADVSHRDNIGYTPLHLAVLGGFDMIVAELAARASRQGHLEIRDANGNTALILATLERRESMVQTLLHHQASCETPGPQGLTALHHAARLGFNDGLHLMMRRASDVNLVDDVGYSAVHHAVTSSAADPQTLHILEAGGADLDTEAGRSGLTPLMLAKRLGKDSFVRQLQEMVVLRKRRAAT